MDNFENGWKKCSSCKKPIAFGAKYFLCSVSSCNGQRTGYVFCSVQCFEVHLPGARHKDAAAIEERAPSKAMATAATMPSTNSSANVSSITNTNRTPQRTIVRPSSSTIANPGVASFANKGPQEVLVIASRLKEYITAKSEFNTSGSVMDVLSEHLRAITDRAIENARADGRKTVLDRDFSFLKK
jgi:hypothetical protein